MAEETNKFLSRAESVIKEAYKIEEAVTAANISLSSGRRRLILLWFLAVFVAINVHDLHVRHCMVQGQPDTSLEQTICNLTFPSHQHFSSETADETHIYFPGVVLWGGIAAVIWAWDRNKTRQERGLTPKGRDGEDE